MPIKFRNKQYLRGATYHIYNRGVEGRVIFREAADFEYFVSQLRRYLDNTTVEAKPGYKNERPYLVRHRQDMNLEGKVELLAYCLMPDRYRLLVRQTDEDGITKLMRRVVTNYSMWFNQKYKRRGMLFENVYRAVQVKDPEDVVRVSCFMHWSPAARVVKRYGIVETVTTITPEEHLYSSFLNYLKKRSEKWVKTDFVLNEFTRSFSQDWDSYNSMVSSGKSDWEKEIGELVIER